MYNIHQIVGNMKKMNSILGDRGKLGAVVDKMGRVSLYEGAILKRR